MEKNAVVPLAPEDDLTSENSIREEPKQQPQGRSFLWNAFIFFSCYFFVRQAVYFGLSLVQDKPIATTNDTYANMSRNLWVPGDNLVLDIYLNQNDLMFSHYFVYQEKSYLDTFKELYSGQSVREEAKFAFKVDSVLLEESQNLRVVLRNKDVSSKLRNMPMSSKQVALLDHFEYQYPLISEQPKIMQKKHENFNADNQYYYPQVYLQLVANEGDIKFTDYPSSIRQKIPIIKIPTGMEDRQDNDDPPITSFKYRHFPILYSNDYWNLRENYKAFDADEPISFEIIFDMVSFFRFQMASQFAFGLKNNEDSYDIDSEDFRRLVGDTHVILIILTFSVSLLHTIFDILAFKNDIEFWKNKKTAKSLEGLSLKSILLNVGMQSIIFLYLLEEETSWVILASSAFALGLEVWKISKAFNLSTSSTFPYFALNDLSTGNTTEDNKDHVTSEASLTKHYDALAMKYLAWVIAPLLVVYSGYAYSTEPPANLYSFILKTLVGFIYAFGFIMMTPQLFINYKLKSVAHLPWKAFVYKALNTFIDDLFAFVIKMPTLHRLATLRDDVIFFVFLYQKYLYPVDMSRKNEFGSTGIEKIANVEEDALVEKADLREDLDSTTEASDSENRRKADEESLEDFSELESTFKED